MSLLKMIDEIDTLITNSASIATIKPKLHTLREQTQALDVEVSRVKIKYDELQARYEKAVADWQKQEFDLKQQVAKLQVVDDESATDLCPYCKRRKGKLIDIKPHSVFGNMGVKVEYYRCTNCGKDYDQEKLPPGQIFRRPGSGPLNP
jgi:uncharacterized protein with PIN domain